MNLRKSKPNESWLIDPKQEDNFVAKCTDIEDKALNAALSLLYYLLINVVYIVIMLLWLRKRNLFPIRERSPWLVFLGIFGSFLSFQVIPILFFAALFNDSYNLYPTEGLREDNPHYEVLRTLRALLFALQDVIIPPYIFRTIRIYAVFNTKLRNIYVRRLLSKELNLILISVGLATFSFLFAYFFPPCLSTPYLIIHGECLIDGFKDNFWTIYNTFLLIAFLFCAFLIRNVLQEYSLLKETLYIFLLYLVSFSYYTIAAPFSIRDGLFTFCLGPFPLYLLIYDLNPIIVMLVITIHPMRKSARNHMPLPPTSAVNELSFFLIEPQFFVVFFNFLECLEKNNSSNPNSFLEKHATTYLKFYFDVKMLTSQINASTASNNQEERQKIKDLISNYFPRNQTNGPFPDILRRMVSEREREFSCIELDILVRFCLRCLRFLFRIFKKTHSFKFIKKQMSNLDEINDNLFSFNVIRDAS